MNDSGFLQIMGLIVACVAVAFLLLGGMLGDYTGRNHVQLEAVEHGHAEFRYDSAEKELVFEWLPPCDEEERE